MNWIGLIVGALVAWYFAVYPYATMKITCTDDATGIVFYQDVVQSFDFPTGGDTIPTVCKFRVMNKFEAFAIQRIDLVHSK